MNDVRLCCRPGCNQIAVATLTYVYSDSTAVLGQLSTQTDPHTWDLCAHHAMRFSAPKGWDLVRSELPVHMIPIIREEDDLTALAEAVRERAIKATGSDTGKIPIVSQNPLHQATISPAVEAAKKTSRRGHLRLLPDLK